MKKISLILAVVMLFASMLTFCACGKDGNGDETGGEASKAIAPKDAVIKDMVAAIEEDAPYAEYVSEFLYKAEDPDEMLCWTYGVIDIKGYELLDDYVITMPSDYSQSLAIIKFKDGMTADDFAEVKEVVTTEYIKVRASQLQMYMPDQYKNMSWALENPDKIWRQYGDNMLVLAIYGGEEATHVWEAIDEYLAGEYVAEAE